MENRKETEAGLDPTSSGVSASGTGVRKIKGLRKLHSVISNE